MNNVLRFCYECSHRIKVNGLPKGEYRCELNSGVKIFDSTDASQCIESGLFEEINGMM